MTDPVSFTDEQFTIIVDAAQIVPPRLRSRFLTDATNRLAQTGVVTNVAVSQAINLALRELQAVG